jgi:hypothetical protein
MIVSLLLYLLVIRSMALSPRQNRVMVNPLKRFMDNTYVDQGH